MLLDAVSMTAGVFLRQYNVKAGDCLTIKRMYNDSLKILINPEDFAEGRQVLLLLFSSVCCVVLVCLLKASLPILLVSAAVGDAVAVCCKLCIRYANVLLAQSTYLLACKTLPTLTGNTT